MFHTLLGEEGFRAGVDLYFARHDGEAVTTDDFLAAMRDANPKASGSALGPCFARWYSQAGTPELSVECAFAADDRRGDGSCTLTITATQSTPATPDEGGGTKLPVCIPLAVGLLSRADGSDVVLTSVVRHTNQGSGEGSIEGSSEEGSSRGRRPVQLAPGATTAVLRCDEERVTFTFEGLPAGGVVPSLLRGFSAPVRLHCTPATSLEDAAFLLANDSDAFNRSEAARLLFERMIESATAAETAEAEGEGESGGGAVAWSLRGAGFGPAVDGLRRVLCDDALEPAFKALALELPSMPELVDGQRSGARPSNPFCCR